MRSTYEENVMKMDGAVDDYCRDRGRLGKGKCKDCPIGWYCEQGKFYYLDLTKAYRQIKEQEK